MTIVAMLLALVTYLAIWLGLGALVWDSVLLLPAMRQALPRLARLGGLVWLAGALYVAITRGPSVGLYIVLTGFLTAFFAAPLLIWKLAWASRTPLPPSREIAFAAGLFLFAIAALYAPHAVDDVRGTHTNFREVALAAADDAIGEQRLGGIFLRGLTVHEITPAGNEDFCRYEFRAEVIAHTVFGLPYQKVEVSCTGGTAATSL